ncbi:MAG: phosphopentomutase, partial [Faecalibacillus sp.]
NADTIGHICEIKGGLHVPVLQSLGLGNLGNFKGIMQVDQPKAYALKLNEISNGKDMMTGHWEMMGLKTTNPFITFTETGFPDEFIQQFEVKTGRKCVGNIACSGTEILDMYGEHQMRTGDWIVYTSADSVFQIAAHEEIISLDELYNACQIAREIAMDDRWKVGRIIARPYVGKKKGNFIRTSNRHDYALSPFDRTALDELKDHSFDVIGIGKIADIFVDQGITKKIHTISNEDGMEKTINLLNEEFTGLAFTNLVDFDALYGHRRNAIGYGDAIESFDRQLSIMIENLKEDDLLMITADHGNDPTYKGTDHTREQVPLLIYSNQFQNCHIIDEQDTFGTIGATICHNFGIPYYGIGKSILEDLK